MFRLTTEISLERFYNISYRFSNIVLFYTMFKFSLAIIDVYKGNYYNYTIMNYIRLASPHAINLLITIFTHLLFLRNFTLIDKIVRFTSDTVIIIILLKYIYY